MKYILLLGILCATAMGIAVIMLGDGGRVKTTVLKRASFVSFSEELVEGYTVSNCFSESVFSTHPDKSLMDYQVLVKGIYTNEANDVVIRLGAVRRNRYCRYEPDPEKAFVQLYTILYMSPDKINQIHTLSFAIDRD